jgi:hypothetical protein
VYLTHHETGRTDAQVDAILAGLREQWSDSGLDFDMAREGEAIVV